MTRSLIGIIAAVAGALAPAAALGHPTITSGPIFANTSQELTFGMSHGCGTDDTYALKLVIPAGVTSVRSLTSDFGKATVEKDPMGNVTSITWQKAEADLLPSDTAYYKFSFRARLPNTPFTTLYFPVYQTCKSATGTLTVVDWVGTGAQPPDAGVVEPALAVVVVPARRPGWNKFTVPVAVPDTRLSTYFSDAMIVWRGTEAFSPNPVTVMQIDSTSGVSTLTGGLQPNQEIWVRY